mmetsp:Transcript_137932/g.344325  ORF Transcript_137932/g.344325 Transcript_137932/m.344325 type:complete len:103 (+) Transcript_137932:448-756(+)
MRAMGRREDGDEGSVTRGVTAGRNVAKVAAIPPAGASVAVTQMQWKTSAKLEGGKSQPEMPHQQPTSEPLDWRRRHDHTRRKLLPGGNRSRSRLNPMLQQQL